MNDRACIAAIALGANLGDRLANLRSAAAMLAESSGLRLLAASRLYETTPLGPSDQPQYLNACVAVETNRPPRTLLDACLRTELELGRSRPLDAVRWGPRIIDLDLLLYGGRAIDEPGLTVPHPSLHERGFVLEPLADIAGEALHPVLGRTIADLRDRFRNGRNLCAGVDVVSDVWLPEGVIARPASP